MQNITLSTTMNDSGIVDAMIVVVSGMQLSKIA